MTLLIAGVLHALSLLGQERPVKAADMHYALRLHYPRPLPHCIPPNTIRNYAHLSRTLNSPRATAGSSLALSGAASPHTPPA